MNQLPLQPNNPFAPAMKIAEGLRRRRNKRKGSSEWRVAMQVGLKQLEGKR